VKGGPRIDAGAGSAEVDGRRAVEKDDLAPLLVIDATVITQSVPAIGQV
jgi:hypothetical protein